MISHYKSQDEMRKHAVNLVLPEYGFLLEIGCSDGNFAELVNNKINNYIGVDIQQWKIDKAKENMRKIEFGLIENQFGQAVNHYNKKAQIYEGLKEEANQITNGKTLSKRPN